jgi:hypothetical protein
VGGRDGEGRATRAVAAAVVVLVVLAAACGGPSSDDGGSAGGDVGGATVDPGPEPLTGDTDTDPSHWDDGRPWEPPHGGTQRAYGGDQWSVVDGFPQGESHCDSVQRRVVWRSLGVPLVAAVTTYAVEPGELGFVTIDQPNEGVPELGHVDVEAEEPAEEGEIVLSGCEQPVFRTTEPDVLEDYVVEVTEHDPAA